MFGLTLLDLLKIDEEYASVPRLPDVLVLSFLPVAALVVVVVVVVVRRVGAEAEGLGLFLDGLPDIVVYEIMVGSLRIWWRGIFISRR